MAESLATTVERNGASTEQMARSVQSVAQSGQRIADAASGAATSATRARTAEPVGRRRWPRRPTRSPAARAGRRGGRRQRAALDPGLRPGQGVDGAVGHRHPRDGQAGQRDQQHRGHDQPDRRADESAVAERVDRGGARRRRGPRVRGRRRGDPQPRRPLGQGDGRHRRRSSRRFRKWRSEAVDASNEGLRVVDQSNAQAEEGARGWARSSTVSQRRPASSARSPGPARSSARRRGTSLAAITAHRGTGAARLPRATDEQARAVTTLVQAKPRFGRPRRR